MTIWRSRDGAIELRLGDWRDVLAGFMGAGLADAVITDPPYSARTHAGQRSHTDLEQTALGYAELSDADIGAAAGRLASMAPWCVVFSDHVGQRAWESSLRAECLYVFAPVGWVKPDGPRFAGDGPCCSVEWITVARARSARKPGSLPGRYIVGRGNGSVIGAKDLHGMRAIVRDYTRPGDLIVDPFAGSGSTLIAAAIEHRRAIGAEIDPATFAETVRRLESGYTACML